MLPDMATFSIERSITIAAAPEVVHALVNDFHCWTRWSPWEGIDPALERSYAGPEAGVGAHYAWQGTRKAGQGAMEITGSEADVIRIRLEFVKPWRAVNQIEFRFAPAGAQTGVTWTMSGEQSGLMAIIGKLMPMEKLIGKDFEKGLAQLKIAAESP
jgi:hypothetical protein